MKIYLIRHGIAESRAMEKNDSQRILTRKGITKTQKVAQKLTNLDIEFDVIITSPYTRAKETAIILQQAKRSLNIVEHSALIPQGNILEWFNWLQTSPYKSAGNIALIGHEPDLSEWAQLLIWGKTEDKLILKKAGIIGLEVADLSNPLGTAQLFLLASPKWISC
ncbi:phosphohistidine phosphatase SixA [Cyanobacterium aponinum UTEX 3222]|uniref:Phosphohistidine phosphatase, SixA n=3 Tax=Cyanobacterium aponinum TaxID=379064 RepID=K9Z0N0_CYAAP|nr:phosphohistidine phosphatase SixA [Cyanobacterium aponinum]WRL42281.1 phosphohistidine phosphatase SixA [Cyanobacterium aponinum UTEX 3222]AFZ52282.1 phosphohistidine phosphatase, SixA [Cyanobacterium aponinum PCC 10605]MBD2393092.1 phosphohistidine phosphatase SixA [Cyanobacterium aponinum FACHB-4101]MTF38070.1 phosphohistidine phosphatase SixA [Cyanobacterium aponinum 0216]PHV63077.1 phosphohistidine phosphatase SixA [Cyanobacterium aponinum IPPAS B-1201]